MKARPSFQFYPADWLRDPGLRSCSLGARGLWIDLLSFMHEAEPYGHLRLNGHDIGPDVLARMVGAPLKEVQRYLGELEAAGVFSRTMMGTPYSRRMVRDEELREKRAACGYLSHQNPAVPRKKAEGKDTIKDTSPLSLGESFGGSPSSSSSSSEIKIDTSSPAVNHEFEEFWNNYPMRNGKRLGRHEAVQKWNRLKTEDHKQVLIAVHNYASSKLVAEGIGIKDPHRWLRNGKGEPWRDWIEPEQPLVRNGHASSRTCTKRIQIPGDRFIRDCGKRASSDSRPTEPRCVDHLTPAALQGVPTC